MSFKPLGPYREAERGSRKKRQVKHVFSPLPPSVDEEAVGRLDVDVIHAGLRGLCDESNRALPRKIALLLSSKQI